MREHRLAVLLSAVAGYVDTLGFLALSGIFTAHVTGNFVLVGVAAGRGEPDVLSRLAVLPCFLLGIVLAYGVHVKSGRLAWLLGLEALFLALFALSGSLGHPHGWVWTSSMGALAMGIQNAIQRLPGGPKETTTVMTGNVTHATLQFLTSLRGGEDAPQARRQAHQATHLLLAFFAGAIGGGLGFREVGFPALLPPTLLVALAALWLSRE